MLELVLALPASHWNLRLVWLALAPTLLLVLSHPAAHLTTLKSCPELIRQCWMPAFLLWMALALALVSVLMVLELVLALPACQLPWAQQPPDEIQTLPVCPY